MFRRLIVLGFACALVASVAAPSLGRDRPFGTAALSYFEKVGPSLERYDTSGGLGQTGSGLSKKQIERFTCEAEGDPTGVVDISCDDPTLGQDWAPDNEIAIAVDPDDPDHLVAGSNDYFYSFNNATGARQAVIPTGFFTSFDGGETWVDGQIPLRSGNGAGDPAPAFDVEHGTVIMAQLENVGGLSGATVARGDVSVSVSTDGGLTWSAPITVMKGSGAGIGPAKNAVFWDKEWLTVDNHEGSPNRGRAYLTATRFQSGLQGSYLDSPIFLSFSDDGGWTWTGPFEISGSNATYCTYQETGEDGECDEDQFSIPVVAPDGTLYVHFLNGQNTAAWDDGYTGFEDLFDSQIMVTRSIDGGYTFTSPVPAVQLEDGFADMPFSIIGRQTVWGHQVRWTSAGTMVASPLHDGSGPNEDLAIVYSGRGTPNPNATLIPFDDGEAPCYVGAALDLYSYAPAYDPCGAGPGADTAVWVVTSSDGGQTWSAPTALAGTDGDGLQAWFPWAGYLADGTLVAAWDQDDLPAAPVSTDPIVTANDTFHHVYWDGSSLETLGEPEHPDVSATHWVGQYLPPTLWPTVCGPAGSDSPGKDCNVFDGDYTGLAVGADDSVNIVWTGLNALVTTPQLDWVTGLPHEGYRQDAMFARR